MCMFHNTMFIQKLPHFYTVSNKLINSLSIIHDYSIKIILSRKINVKINFDFYHKSYIILLLINIFKDFFHAFLTLESFQLVGVDVCG